MMDTGADESLLDFLNGDDVSSGYMVILFTPIFRDSIPELPVQESAGDLSTILMEGWF